MTPGRCRFCDAPLTTTFVDLGASPLANSFLAEDDLGRMEPFYPLHAMVCDACFLVQLPEFASPREIFSDYAYLSSMSDSWLAHCKAFADAAVARFGLTGKSLVVEVASNDGYLLRWFKDRGVRVLGIEPAENVAKIAEGNGVPTMARFFGTKLAGELASGGTRADLLVGNNVLAHVPDLNDFVRGLAALLAPGIAPRHVPAQDGEMRNSIADVSAIGAELGWAPARRGVDFGDVVAWWRARKVEV